MLIRLLSYAHQYKKYTVAAVVCVTAEAVFELIIPLLMADIVDVGVASGDIRFIFQRGVLMVVCAVLALILGMRQFPVFRLSAGRGVEPS